MTYKNNPNLSEILLNLCLRVVLGYYCTTYDPSAPPPPPDGNTEHLKCLYNVQIS